MGGARERSEQAPGGGITSEYAELTPTPARSAELADPPRKGEGEESYSSLRAALAQFFSDDHTLRERRKQSTGLEEPSASKRCSSTPVHWKPHFSRILRDIGFATRARPYRSSWSNASKK